MIDMPTLPDAWCYSIRHAMERLPDGKRTVFLERLGAILRQHSIYRLTEQDVDRAVELSLRGMIHVIR